MRNALHYMSVKELPMTHDDLLELQERLVFASTHGFEVAHAEGYADKLESLGAEKPEGAASATSLLAMANEVLAGATPKKPAKAKEPAPVPEPVKAAVVEPEPEPAKEEPKAEEPAKVEETVPADPVVADPEPEKTEDAPEETDESAVEGTDEKSAKKKKGKK